MLKQRLPHLAEFCVICDEEHQWQTRIMMTCCTRTLCIFQFKELKIGTDSADSVASSTDVVDLLVSLSRASALSQRADLVFNPYPTIRDPTDEDVMLFEPDNKGARVRARQPCLCVAV